MSILESSVGCDKCGCTGIHACIGRRLPPPTPEEEERLGKLNPPATLEETLEVLCSDESARIIEEALNHEIISALIEVAKKPPLIR